MLVAPLVLSERSPSRRRRLPVGRKKRGMPSARVLADDGSRARVLVAWLALGLCAVICVPAARGGELLGATLPFWLVGAPLINFLWWKRSEVLDALRRRWISARSRRSQPAAVRIASERRTRGG